MTFFRLERPSPRLRGSFLLWYVYITEFMTKKKMTDKAARRIQSHSDRTGKNMSFKSHAMKATTKKIADLFLTRK